MKFGRETDQRRALLKGLADSLVLNGSIETTLPKAKAAATYTEKLITKAKKAQQNLHIRRRVISKLNTLEAAHKLVDEMAPKLTARNSGYLRVTRTGIRRGDGVQLARVSFVDKLDDKKIPKAEVTATKPTEAETAIKLDDKASMSKQITPTDQSTKLNTGSPAQAPKRSGRRGDR